MSNFLVKIKKSLYGRFDDRTNKALKNVIFSFLIKGGSILISLAFVPLLIHELNPERYGVWLTVTSILTLLGFSDVGLGNGTKNLLTECITKNDFDSARRVVSTAYFSISGISLSFIILILIFGFKIKWGALINAPSYLNSELSYLFIILIVFFCIQLILKLLNSIFEAIQMAAYSNLVYTLGQFLAFIGVYIISKIHPNAPLITYGLIISFAPVFTLFIATIIFFSKNKYKITPSIRFFDMKYVKDLYLLGAKFFVIQITALVLYQSNNLIIAHVCGANDVAVFNIVYKYAGLTQMLFLMMLAPIWAASTEAYHRADFQWMKKTIKRLNLVLSLFIGVALIQFLLSKKIYMYWIGETYNIDFKITFGILIYFVLSMRSGLYCTIINGIGKIQFQFFMTLLQVFIHIPLAIFLGKLFGLLGVISSMSIIMFLNSIWMPFQCNKLLNNTARGILNK